MKHLYLLILLFWTATLGYSQNNLPEGINYQAVVYDEGNQNPGLDAKDFVLRNQNVSIRFTIIEETSNGTEVFQETHATKTDNFGLFSIIIGKGTQTSSNAFSSISWGKTAHFLKVEIDKKGGSNYHNMGVQELWSVPYSLSTKYAENAGNGITGVIDNGDGTMTFTYQNGSKYITPKLVGLTGPKGDIGLTGAQGLKGDTGLQGLQGIAGTNGTNGLDGKTVLNGTIDPDMSLGVNGDFYINTSNNKLFGPKSSSVWPSGISLIGAQGQIGSTGPAGANGNNGASGSQGVQGASGAKGDKGDKGDIGSTGSIGKSAYELAVINGFNGTELQWVASLKGVSGVKGDKGDIGSTGSTGKSAYELAVINGFVGTESEWITSLKGVSGAKGDKGEKGDTGLTGAKGDAGTQGSQGTQGLKGDTGAQGIPGNQGVQGAKGGDLNIYNADGTLTSNRTISIESKNLIIDGTGQTIINGTTVLNGPIFTTKYRESLDATINNDDLYIGVITYGTVYTLPLPTTLQTGRILVFVDLTGGNSFTVSGADATSVSAPTLGGGSLTYLCTGSKWVCINGF